ncbi:MAG: FecR domain-containing protein [Bacteroidota bacterium]
MQRKTEDPDFNLAEFLEDPAFVAWVTAPDAQSDLYWNNFQQEKPQSGAIIHEARRFILAMRFEQQFMDDASHKLLWERIAGKTLAIKPFNRALPLWIRSMAAAIITLVLCGTIFYFYSNRPIEIFTGYGQTKEVVLPDGSMVTLNANSSIRYNKKLSDGQPRELWLNGEAFFRVKHLYRYGQKIAGKDLFLVHAGKVDIKVMGTTFNVNERRGFVKVALVTGKVSMQVLGNANNELIMKPGQVIYYDLKKNVIALEPIGVRASIAWKEGLLIFNELSAQALFDQLENNYGYKAVFIDAGITQKSISGTFASGNFDKLLQGIGIALDISIVKQEHTHQLIIRNNFRPLR